MKRLRVLTLNIWNRMGPWPERLPLIRAGIQALRPDIVGLQEVIESDSTTQAHTIAEGSDFKVAYGAAHDLGGGVKFGNAVLSRFPIEKSLALALPVGTGQEPRSLLATVLDSEMGSLPFFVTHLNWMFHHGNIREKQVQAVAALVNEHAPVAGLPPIVVGDFNAAPDATEIRFMRGLTSLEGKSVYFADCFGDVGAGPGYTFDSQVNPHAALTHDPPRRIDYVFVRGPDSKGRGKPMRAQVVLDTVIDDVAPSDHYGVFAEIAY